MCSTTGPPALRRASPLCGQPSASWPGQHLIRSARPVIVVGMGPHRNEDGPAILARGGAAGCSAGFPRRDPTSPVHPRCRRSVAVPSSANSEHRHSATFRTDRRRSRPGGGRIRRRARQAGGRRNAHTPRARGRSWWPRRWQPDQGFEDADGGERGRGPDRQHQKRADCDLGGLRPQPQRCSDQEGRGRDQADAPGVQTQAAGDSEGEQHSAITPEARCSAVVADR